jgi:hypothetical protein
MPVNHNILAYITGLILLLAVFSFSLFKNISYPLLWNDEAETAEYAERIMNHGYPKVHDGKNVLNLFCQQMDVSLKKEYDAYIGSVWGQYYFCVPGAWLARKTNDLYLKSALLRIPFALIGMLGVLLAAGLFLPCLNDPGEKLRYLIGFFLFEFVSVYIVLYLREVRYYSLLIFLSAAIIYVYTLWKFHNRISNKKYFFLMFFLLFLLFNVFYPAMVGISCFIAGYEILEWLSDRWGGTDYGKNSFQQSCLRIFYSLLPIIAAFFLIFPLVHFFEMVKLSSLYSSIHHFNMKLYWVHLHIILGFFQKNDFLILVLSLKLFLFLLRFYYRNCIKSQPGYILQCRYVDFLFLFYLVMTFFLSRLPVLWERYYVWLNPFWIAMFIADLKMIYSIVKANTLNKRRSEILLGLIVMILSWHIIWEKSHMIEGHMEELFHRYKGPLDFVIPYIKENYPHPEHLVIATNYEEPSYMYYLKSKVTIGFNANNLAEDLQFVPDIIIYRKNWNGIGHDLLQNLTKRSYYKQTVFFVFDYPVNNIPESGLHLFKTMLPCNHQQCVTILEKITNDSKS